MYRFGEWILTPSLSPLGNYFLSCDCLFTFSFCTCSLKSGNLESHINLAAFVRDSLYGASDRSLRQEEVWSFSHPPAAFHVLPCNVSNKGHVHICLYSRWVLVFCLFVFVCFFVAYYKQLSSSPVWSSYVTIGVTNRIFQKIPLWSRLHVITCQVGEAKRESWE